MSGGTHDIIHDAQSKRHRSTSALGTGLAVRTPLGGGGVRATSVVLSLPNQGISGARGASFGDDMLDGVRQGSLSKMPAVKSIRYTEFIQVHMCMYHIIHAHSHMHRAHAPRNAAQKGSTRAQAAVSSE